MPFSLSALDRKALRDLWQIRGLATAIAIVMACGVALFTLSRSMLHSLELTQDSYYDRYQFADIFVSLKRAPLSAARRISEIPGVAAVETRIVVSVNLAVEGLSEPASGRLISAPDGRPSLLNRLVLREGNWLEPRSDDQALASESFVRANALRVGDAVAAVINGHYKKLRIVGVVLSPEYIYEIKPGDMVPDNRHFGVMWMNEEALATAYDLHGAFNDAAIKVMRGTNEAEVLRSIDRVLAPYGGLGAYGRSDQLSHQFVDNEIKQNRTMGLFAPSIFLGVAAFLLNIVMSRTIHSQRDQIAALKAFGYSNVQVGWHYVKSALLIALGALALGIPLGIWFGQVVTQMYAKLFHFPEFSYRLYFSVVASAAGVCLFAGIAGSLGAVFRAARLPPAEAMRPEPPSGYGPTILERLGFSRLIPPIARMVLRQLERRPIKTLLSAVAIALAAAVMVVGNFLDDAVDYMMKIQFYRVQRYDMAVTMIEPVDERALYELSRLPGVIRCETRRSAAVRLRSGPRSRRLALVGMSPEDDLVGLINQNDRETSLPSDGLLLSRKLAEALGVRIGDWIEVEFMEGKRSHTRALVAATLDDFVGLFAYVDRRSLHRMLGESPVVTGAQLKVDEHTLNDLYRELKQTPKVAGVTVKSHAIASFLATVGENLGIMKSINLLFASAIAIGVVYNSARISLAERSRELATLRVIGFTRGEISAILLGELAIVTLMAIPLGLALGRAMAQVMCMAFDQELFRFALVISRRTYALASAVVLASALGSGLIVRRRLDRLDLIGVLKSRE